MGKADGGKVEPATLADLLAQSTPERTLVLTLDNGKRVSMRFRAIGRSAWQALIADHPPTTLMMRWNAETFEPAAVAASLVEPVFSEAEVRELFASPGWSKGRLDAVTAAALAVNEEADNVEQMGKGF